VSRRKRTPKRKSRKRSLAPPLRFPPEVIIFDVDGVLVDVRGSFHTTVIQTVQHFTNQKVTRHELHRWKNRSGFNDDWKLSTAWVQSLGGKQQYEEVKAKFVELYWGAAEKGGKAGNVAREKWLLPRASLRRLAKRAELALFTGRVAAELDYTLDRCQVREFFRRIVTVEDVHRPKPDPEGLRKILAGRDPAKALYLGDNVDDALSAQAAKISFIGILPQSAAARGARAALLRSHGAIAVLRDVTQLESWLGPHRT
jgi:HAD superfamily hydrolase (TIGR01548 family)